jgi:hypothetical protein
VLALLLGLVGAQGGGVLLLAVAAVIGLGALWIYEDCWIRAGQSVPMS